MKKVCSILLLLSFGLGYVGAQVPQAFKYQAVIRNDNGEVITSKTVGLRISIIKDNIFGVNAYIETHTVQTNQFGLVNLNIGKGTPVLNTFASIDWSTGSYFIKIEVDPNGGTTYTNAGDPVQLVSVPYALYAEKSNTKAKFEVVDRDGLPSDSALFEVKNAKGQTVFAVYEDGAAVYVNEGAKGGRGGFAVGGRRPGKGFLVEDIMRVTSDSVRIYINDTAVHKGGRGGFAVGGRKPGKGLNNDYFQVTSDSTRIYINDAITKGGKGGFAVGGRSHAKGSLGLEYLRVTSDSTRILTKDPEAGFAVNDLSGNGANYLHIKPENMFIGKQAGERTIGSYNSFFGHQTGLNNTTGAQNIFLGYQTGYTNTIGSSNIFVGPQSGYKNTQGAYNVFIGHNAGYFNETGHDNVFVGQRSGYSNQSGNANLFVGQNSGENNFGGTHNVFLGYETGKHNIGGTRNVYLGTQAGFNDSVGNYNVFLGNEAGFYEKGSNKLYINNSGADKTQALIYGDFNSNELRLNTKVGINSDDNGYHLNVAGDINFNGQLYQNAIPFNPGLVKVDLTENLSSPQPYTNPSLGILVFNIGSKQPKGFYYWEGTKWMRLVASAAPTITCDSITDILGGSAMMHASILSDGGTNVIARGFCWNTTGSPTIEGLHSTEGSGTGSFSSTIYGLTNYTTYMVRAYAQNYAGIAYSQEIQFNAGTPVSVPILYTTPVTSITGTTASTGGTVTGASGSELTARGVCWNSSGNPTISDNKTLNGSGLGSFTSSLTGLSMGITYYLRSYATNSTGTGYGNEYQFTTPTFPTISTSSITGITDSSATGGGNITSQGGAEITQRGVCWSSTNTTPAISDSKTMDGSGAGIFSSTITGLIKKTLYYVRAYATNPAGTAYGETVTFSTGTLPVTDIDGNSYNTVRIGNQIWMVENLRTTRYRNGDAIPNITANGTWSGQIYGAYCWYNNDAATYKNPYGAIYNWYAVVDNRNLCPSGWHAPTDDEWEILETYLGGRNYSGGNLKEVGFAHWLSPNTGATNSSGFTALPGGARYDDGSFQSIGYWGNWWTTSEIDSSWAWYRAIGWDSASGIGGYNALKKGGFSVRCIKD